jgi:hypothetical protein
LLGKSAAERDVIGAHLRLQVAKLHSLPRLAERILEQISRYSSATLRARMHSEATF